MAQGETLVSIPIDGIELEGESIVPPVGEELVAFTHGSASSRHSPRKNFVAETLRERGLGTLLFDLLTEAEDRDRGTCLDVDLLTEGLPVADWLRSRDATVGLRVGSFGSSTGVAGVLRAAGRREDVDAVASRGGRADVAAESPGEVTAATPFVVGGDDTLVEGPGQLEAVANAAADWFAEHLE